MNMVNKESYSADFFKDLKAATGELTVEIDGVPGKYPVLHAEERPESLVFDFSLNNGGPGNSFIGVVIKKDALNRKVTLPDSSVYFLFQNVPGGQEWVADKGWLHVVWVNQSKKIEGLFDEVSSDRAGSSMLNNGKFKITLG